MDAECPSRWERELTRLILIEKYGADATRFGLIYQMMGGQDIKFDESHLLAGKKIRQ